MKHALLPALLLAGVSCSTYGGDGEIAYTPVIAETTLDSLNVEVPRKDGYQYLAWSSSENRAVGGTWTDSLGEAQSRGSAYQSKYPAREWTILWREGDGTETRTPTHPKP